MHTVVQKNINCEEGTFLYFLHEKNSFNEALYREYLEDMSSINAESCDREITKRTIALNGFILRNFLYHFMPSDLCFIKDLPSNLNDYIEEIDFENSRLIRML